MIPDGTVDFSCACKGVRRCLRCEKSKGKGALETNSPKIVHHFMYDPETKRAVSRDGSAASFPFPGIFLWENFITEEEEEHLISTMDQNMWNESQSGRRKQDFGPKVNFKKKRIRLGGFSGLPVSSQKLLDRMQRDPSLADFRPVEQCNLDYDPQRGSAIDPHLDDSWLWGERLVTINMLSDTTLTMSLDRGLLDQGSSEEVQVAVCLPRRCLLVLHGEARHQWKHAIHREDVEDRRVCSTFRELSAEFLPGGQQAQLGAQLLDIALSFHGTPM